MEKKARRRNAGSLAEKHGCWQKGRPVNRETDSLAEKHALLAERKARRQSAGLLTKTDLLAKRRHVKRRLIDRNADSLTEMQARRQKRKKAETQTPPSSPFLDFPALQLPYILQDAHPCPIYHVINTRLVFERYCTWILCPLLSGNPPLDRVLTWSS